MSMYYTTNLTTTVCGQSTATVIADTTCNGKRITTYELVFPRYIHSELLTHRVCSRNASSSRATPIAVTCAEVENDPVFFDSIGLNQPGMVAGAEIPDDQKELFKKEWIELGQYVASKVRDWDSRFHIHKQVLNRALEPWLRIRVILTSTAWENFFKLRLAPDAKPEIRNLALAMQQARGFTF